MKNFLSLVAVAALLTVTSCKKSEDTVSQPAVEKDDKQKTDHSLFRNPSEFATVVVEKSADSLVWKAEDADGSNGSRINEQLIYFSNDTHFYVNLYEFNDRYTDGELSAYWLRNNRDRIDFELTEIYVEATHRISHPEKFIVMFKRKLTDYTMKMELKDLTDEIDNTISYESDKYNKYVEFRPGQTPNIVLHDEFKFDDYRFSLPLLRSIIKVNRLAPEDWVAIGVSPATNDEPEFTYLWVEKTNTYYNFSTEPR